MEKKDCLAEYSLVCKGWRRAAQEMIFEDVGLFGENILAFLCMVESSRNKVGEYVKNLSLDFTFPDTISQKPWSRLYKMNIPRIAAACPNVKSLKFYLKELWPLLIEELKRRNWKHLEYIHRLINGEGYDFYVQNYLKAPCVQISSILNYPCFSIQRKNKNLSSTAMSKY